MDKILLSVFTDGTGNDAIQASSTGTRSNVAKLFAMWDDTRSKNLFRAKHYVVGVGTAGGLDTLVGGFTGAGFRDRVDEAMRWIWETSLRFPLAAIDVQLFGFSRGAAEAMHLVNLLNDPDDLAKYGLTGRKVRVVFAGLFDPVASLGLPGNGIDPGARLNLHPSQVDVVVSLVAQAEVRALFDLQSIRLAPPGHDGSVSVTGGDWQTLWKSCPLPTEKWEEWLMPGVHSDVGGGYEPEEWIPDLPVLPPQNGESVSGYIYRMKNRELNFGAAPRGVTGNDFRSRENIQDRVKSIYDEKMKAWTQKRNEELAGNHQVTLGEADREHPVLPALRVRDNSLSLVSLWFMIRRSEKAGVKWKTIGQLDESTRSVVARLPNAHPLYALQMQDLSPADFENELRLSNDRFWNLVVPCIHDSRLATDLAQRDREVYFCGRKD